MKRFLLVGALLVALTATLPAYVSYFTVTSIREQTLVSHDRIKITINTGGNFFPYTGQIGWRIFFSQYEMGDQDPQYQYAVWVLPAQSADLSQEIWFVRPSGLDGLWHYRIDAVDANRAPIATSGELTYTFTSETAVYTDTLAYVAQTEPYWMTSIAFTDDSGQVSTLKLFFYDDKGYPYPVLHGENVYEIEVPANGTWTGYLGTICPHQFTGNIKMESSNKLRWVAVISGTFGLLQTGKLE